MGIGDWAQSQFLFLNLNSTILITLIILIKNFDPSLISKGQEMTFTLKDTNAFDEGDNNLNINENSQIDEVKYDKDTGI